MPEASPLAVLWIDDEAAVLSYATRLLTRNGFEIMVATTGSIGLAHARQTTFDLIVLDLQLPDMSGLEVLRRLRSAQSRTPIAILTAFPSEASAFEAGSHGAMRYLTKPLVGSALIRALRSSAAAAHGIVETSPDEPWVSSHTALGASLAVLRNLANERRPDPTGSHEVLGKLIAHFVDADVDLTGGRLALPQFAAMARIVRLLVGSPGCPDPVLNESLQLIDRAIGFDLAELDPILSQVLERFGNSAVLQEEGLADAFGVHASTMSRMLQSSLGFGYRELRWAALVRPSIKPLARTLEPIRHVAVRCGYDSHNRISQFVRDFEHVFGISPSAFRRIARHG